MTDKKCPDCGVEILDEEAAFCSKCGSTLKAPESEMDDSDLNLEAKAADKEPIEEDEKKETTEEAETKETAEEAETNEAEELKVEPAGETKAEAVIPEPPVVEPIVKPAPAPVIPEEPAAPAAAEPAQPQPFDPNPPAGYPEPPHRAFNPEQETVSPQRSVAGPVVGGIVVGLLIGGVCGCLVQKGMDDKNYGEKIEHLEKQLSETEDLYEESQKKADEYERQHEEIQNILNELNSFNSNSNANDNSEEDGKVNVGGFWIGDKPDNSNSNSNSNSDKSDSSESKTKSQPGVLGVRLSTNPDDGAKIVAFSRDSAAKTAGLKVGDIIAAIDGSKVSSSEEVVNLIAQYEQGDTIEVKTESGNTYKVTLG